LAAAGAVAVGAVLARIIERPTPFDAVGTVVIDHTPAGVKHWAIATFGTHDKQALRIGVAAVLVLAAAVLGVTARNRRGPAVIGVAAFTLVGALASTTRHGSGLSAVWPSAFGGLAALGVFACLLWSRSERLALGTREGTATGADGNSVLSWPTRSRA